MPCIRDAPTEVVFSVENGVDPGVEAFLRRAVEQARRYFAFRVPDCGRFVPGVRLSPEGRGPWAATVSRGRIYVRGGDEAWILAPENARYALVFHEWFHLVQDALARYRRGGVPDWLAEGAAQWAGFRAAIHFGYYPSYAGVRADQRARALAVSMPLERLSKSVPVGDAYALAFMAIDVLEVPARTLLRFWKVLGEGESWRHTFQGVFGESVKRFYRRFERARAAGFP